MSRRFVISGPAAFLMLVIVTLSVTPVRAQDNFDDCTIAGIGEGATGFFQGRDWDNFIDDNQLGFGFALSRPFDYASPGEWSVTIDWGDGTIQDFKDESDVPSTTGPLPPGYGPPPVWVVHTYDAPGTYDVRVTAEGIVNTISDGSGENQSCETDFTNTFVIGQGGGGGATAADGEPTTADGAPASGGDGGGGDDGGGLSPLIFGVGGVIVVAALGGGAWMMSRQRANGGAAHSGPAPVARANARLILGTGSYGIDENGDGTPIVIRATFGDATRVELEDGGT